MLRQAQYIYLQTCSNNVQLDNIYYMHIKDVFFSFVPRIFPASLIELESLPVSVHP